MFFWWKINEKQESIEEEKKVSQNQVYNTLLKSTVEVKLPHKIGIKYMSCELDKNVDISWQTIFFFGIQKYTI